MGLDQYLYCNSKTVCKAANKAIGGKKWHEFCGICAYWRKANQIHGWFVEHVQYGEDDCGMHEVTVGHLKELLETVETVLGSTRLVDGTIVTGYRLDGDGPKPIYKNGKVLEDSSVASELLPTQDGFFFGNTEYDQFYWNDLEYTKNVIEAILASVHKVKYEMFEGYETEDWMPVGENDWEVRFQYQSSW